MGLLNESRREFIAAPDTSKGQIVFKWPDDNIRKFARAIVEPDAQAVFMSQGKVMGVLPPGQHTLDASELPFLGMFIDWASAGNAFKAELYFVGTREYPNVRFGGRLDDIQDPMSGLIVTMRAFGEYALKVDDPTKLILNLVGTVDVADNDAVTGWVGQQLLKVTRTAVTTQLASGAWPILGLSQHSPDIEAATMPAANVQLADYGVSICRFGNLDVNLSEEDSDEAEEAGQRLRLLQARRRVPPGGPGRGPPGDGAGHGRRRRLVQSDDRRHGHGDGGPGRGRPRVRPRIGTPEAPNFAGAPVGGAGYPVAAARTYCSPAAGTAPAGSASPLTPSRWHRPPSSARVATPRSATEPSSATPAAPRCRHSAPTAKPSSGPEHAFCDSCGTAVA